MPSPSISLKSHIIRQIQQAPPTFVWTAVDFINLGNRDAIDKALQRLVHSNELRRIDRGLYDQVRLDLLTGQLATPDYRSVIDAIGRRDQIRILIDGMTAANELGLTTAVSGQVIVHTDARLGTMKLGNLTIHFKFTAPSKLYWADRPAMRIVQALYWLRTTLKDNAQHEQTMINTKLLQLLQNSPQQKELLDDLRAGLHTLPSWMQSWIRKLLC